MPASYYAKGDHNVICQRCGFEYKRSQTRIEWDNLIVCIYGCYEERQPQDYVRGIPDIRNVQRTNPKNTPVYLTAPITPGDL